MDKSRHQISIHNLIHIQKITGRSSYNLDSSLTKVLDHYEILIKQGGNKVKK